MSPSAGRSKWTASLGGLATACLIGATAHADPVAALLTRTPEAAGVFEAQPDGAARHVQSGLLCPAKFPNVELWHLEVFPSSLGKGADVGCDYGRNGPDGLFVSKLTIFVTRMTPEETLDSDFAQRQAEVTSAMPGAIEKGPAVQIAPASGSDTQALADSMKSAEYSVTLDGRSYLTDVS